MSILFRIQPKERDLIVEALTHLAEDYREISNAAISRALSRTFLEKAEFVEYLVGVASTLTESLDKHAMDVEVLRLMVLGQKIEAIKVVRANTSYGLKEAKDYVEKLYAESSYGRT